MKLQTLTLTVLGVIGLSITACKKEKPKAIQNTVVAKQADIQLIYINGEEKIDTLITQIGQDATVSFYAESPIGYLVEEQTKSKVAFYLGNSKQNVVLIDSLNLQEGLRYQFTGENKQANEYLSKQKLILPERSDLDSSFQVFSQKVKQSLDVERKALDTIMDKNFVRFENAELDYLEKSNYLNYALAHLPIDSLPQEVKQYTYAPFKKEIFFTRSYLGYVGLLAQVQYFKNNPEQREISPYEGMKNLIDFCKDDRLVGKLLLGYVAAYLQQVEQTNQDSEVHQLVKKYVKSESILTDVNHAFEARIGGLATQGGEAPAFKAEDVNGKAYALNDFSGKFLVIDAWASWCGPCKVQSPIFDELAAKYASDKVAFISISVDQKKEAWLKYIGENKHENSLQLWVSDKEARQFNQSYKVATIPRFIIIDPQGKILQLEAAAPSEGLEDQLKAMLKV